MEKSVKLKSGKEVFVQRQHPWVFSGAIAKTDPDIAEGERIAVLDHKGQRIATGHYQEGSIRVRIIQHGEIEPTANFWINAMQRAYQTRQLLGLIGNPKTNAYRLVHGAGDLLPGLVIDIYGQIAVIQCHSWGMYNERMAVAEALQVVYGNSLGSIYLKANKTLPKRFDEKASDLLLFGEEVVQTVLENGHRFEINVATGQKTGFFLDQRDNRQLLATYSKDKSVLNTFCYTGGFSIYALAAGASKVDSVDVSSKAMALTEANVALQPDTAVHHQGYTSEVMPFLKEQKAAYDIVVVDPPAFAKSFNKRHQAVQGYKRLNTEAMKAVKPGGLLFTFSCSQVVDRQLFQDTIVAAGLEAGRSARVLHQLTQSADHPVNLFHPEGSYLKGLVVQLD